MDAIDAGAMLRYIQTNGQDLNHPIPIDTNDRSLPHVCLLLYQRDILYSEPIQVNDVGFDEDKGRR